MGKVFSFISTLVLDSFMCSGFKAPFLEVPTLWLEAATVNHQSASLILEQCCVMKKTDLNPNSFAAAAIMSFCYFRLGGLLILGELSPVAAACLAWEPPGPTASVCRT